MKPAIEVAARQRDTIGECPLWDEREEALFWIDIRRPALYRLKRPEELSVWLLPETVGSFAFRRSRGFLLALQSGLYTCDGPSSALTLLAEPERDRPTNRFNDGRCDQRGRFWVGTMSDVSRERVGSLYRLDADAVCTRMLGDVAVPNSLAWSPDSRRMYFADTHQRRVWTFEFDLETGAASNQRLFSDASTHPGKPDGSAVDAEGCLWNCEYGGSRIVRYTPAGTIDLVVPLPVSNPTCCAFGERDYRTLFITSATQRLTAEELASQPLAGSVLAMRTAVAGLPEARFAG